MRVLILSKFEIKVIELLKAKMVHLIILLALFVATIVDG